MQASERSDKAWFVVRRYVIFSKILYTLRVGDITLSGTFRILVVDDDPAFCSVLQDGLTSSGYGCKTALGGGPALELIRNDSFDLMLADVFMPGMDGFELSKKAVEIDDRIAVILMTGYITEDSRIQARTSGARDFIEKPFSLERLLDKIKSVRAGIRS